MLNIVNMLFEDMGYTYLGPVDGHNIEKLENILNISKRIEGPKLIHVITKKGKGYKVAEENPDKFHATGPFDIETGNAKTKNRRRPLRPNRPRAFSLSPDPMSLRPWAT